MQGEGRGFKFSGGKHLAKKMKKPKVANRRPAKAGPSAGCGTGAGGFKPGNNCANEDGVPQQPDGKGAGPLKRVPPKQDYAKAKALEATHKQRIKERLAEKKAAAEKAAAQKVIDDKKARIDSLRAAAAKRKAEKKAVSDKEQREAAAQAAKKRAELLQKIRVKKANEQIVIAKTPKSIKDEIAEIKAKKASELLKVAPGQTPPGGDIAREISSYKKQLSIAKKNAGEIKEIKNSEPKPVLSQDKDYSPTQAKPEAIAGSANAKKESSLNQSEIEAHKQDTNKVFGSEYQSGWDYSHKGGSYSDLQIQAKVHVAHSIAVRMEKNGIKESDITDEMLKRFDPGGHYSSPASAANVKNYTGGDLAGYERRYALAAAMTHQWASTSGDGVVNSVGMQYAIRSEFKLKGTYTRHLHPKHSKKFSSEDQETIDRISKDKGVRAVIRAQYQNTQEWLKSQGVTHLTVVRGYKSSAKVDHTAEQGVSMQPASSFSMSKKVASGFVGETVARKRYMVARIPASQVFSTARTGFGCLNEQELTVFGGVVKARVHSQKTLYYSSSVW